MSGEANPSKVELPRKSMEATVAICSPNSSLGHGFLSHPAVLENGPALGPKHLVELFNFERKFCGFLVVQSIVDSAGTSF